MTNLGAMPSNSPIQATSLATGTPTGTKFLKDDMSWAVPPGGGGSITCTTVEKNLGSTPTWIGKFTITDAAIEATSKVLCWQAPGPYTGKGTRADEAEMDPILCNVEPGSGSATVRWQTNPMITQCPMSKMGQGAATSIPKDPQAVSWFQAKRLGKVRGNVKFSYLVFA